MRLNTNTINFTTSTESLRDHVKATGGDLARFDAFNRLGMGAAYCHALNGHRYMAWMLTYDVAQLAA